MVRMTLSRQERRLLAAVAGLAGVWLAIQIAAELWRAVAVVADVILVFLVAWVVAYLLGPLVTRIERHTPLNRAGSVILVYVGIAIVLGGILATAVPGLASQLTALAQRGPEYGDRAARIVIDLQAGLNQAGVPVNLDRLYGSIPGRLGELAAAYASDALGFISTTATLLFNIVLVLIIAFLMLLDGHALWTRLTRALTPELRSEAELFRASADKTFGGFIRGSLLVGLAYGAVTMLTLLPFGVPFSGVLSLIAGLAVIIPFFGPIIAMVPIAVIALLGTPDVFVAVMIVTVVVQQVMFNVVSPRVLSTSVGIHPLLVFAALLVGSRVAGFWGVFLALPITGIAAIFARYAYELARGRRTRSEASGLIDEERAGTT